MSSQDMYVTYAAIQLGHGDDDIASGMDNIYTNVVAVIGFQNDSITLKEGRTSAVVCVGFENLVDSDEILSIPIKLRSANILPDTGHGMFNTTSD